LLGLALLGLIQAGCRSDGCYDCNIGAKISNGVQALAARVTKHFDGCHGGADCGCDGYGGETVIDSGTPVISGGMVMPLPGTVGPGPAIEQAPTQLDPIPNNAKEMSGSSTNPSSTRSTPSSGNTRSSYTTMAPKGTTGQRRGSDVSRALHSSPEATASNDLIDNIPPVDLSPEVTKNATSATKPTPVPAQTPAAAPVASTPAATPAASPPATAAPTPIADPSTPPPAEKVSAAEGAIGTLPPIETPSPFRAPGINRYASVAPTIYGGSAPSIEGLEWLKEKGCRTLIDLRKPSEVDPNFVESVNDRNMVYISLPIVANRLDPSRLARFDDLISATENRPIYFCDIDGTRAGLVWYIHLRATAQEDPQTASGKAEEVGLTEVEAKLAEAYLLVNKPRQRVSSARVALAGGSDREPFKIDMPPVAAPAPTAAPAVQAPRSALPDGQLPVNINPETCPSPSTEPTPSMLPGEDRPQASNDRFRDPAFWRPVAALVMTAIGVPLAYWSRSAFSVSRATRVRASLPGAVQTPSDAPVASDV
jgi:protein tyrosine phosphatase (PTP) superfamily phosphohydrolase (DUF442 family)